MAKQKTLLKGVLTFTWVIHRLCACQCVDRKLFQPHFNGQLPINPNEEGILRRRRILTSISQKDSSFSVRQSLFVSKCVQLAPWEQRTQQRQCVWTHSDSSYALKIKQTPREELHLPQIVFLPGDNAPFHTGIWTLSHSPSAFMSGLTKCVGRYEIYQLCLLYGGSPYKRHLGRPDCGRIQVSIKV